jgi:hypothetical protein
MHGWDGSSASRVGSYVESTRPLKVEARFITQAPLATAGVLRTPPLIATESGEVGKDGE